MKKSSSSKPASNRKSHPSKKAPSTSSHATSQHPEETVTQQTSKQNLKNSSKEATKTQQPPGIEENLAALDEDNNPDISSLPSLTHDPENLKSIKKTSSARQRNNLTGKDNTTIPFLGGRASTITKSIPQSITISILLAIFLLGLIFSFFNAMAADTITPGVTIGAATVPLSNTTKSQAIDQLSLYLEEFYEQGITLTYEDSAWTVEPQSIDLIIDVNATIEKAWKVGRSGVISGIWQRITAIITPYHLEPVYSFDQEKAKLAFIEATQPITDPEANASVSWEDGDILFHEAKIGKGIDYEDAISKLRTQITKLHVPKIPVNLIETQPTIFVDDLEAHQDNIETFFSQTITLTEDDNSWEIPPDTLASLIGFSKTDDTLTLHARKEETLLFLQELAEEIQQDPIEGKFQMKDGAVVPLGEKARDGKELNLNSSYDAITQAFSTIFTQQKEENIIPLAIDVIEPSINAGNVNDLGITEIIGEITTYFPKSSATRLHNINVATNAVNGHLFAPGEVMSFNDTVGPISQATGYESTWVILGNRTVKGDGGGVCQVSTTFFQAGLMAGLPIVERHAHAYRVEHYELAPSLGVGYDATIYSPYTDLKLKNDYDTHILLQAFMPEKAKLTMRFWGTKDGRSVSVTKPKITNTKPVPSPEYIDNPALCSAEVKERQVDYPKKGFTVFGYRTINYNDGREHTDEIKSVFAPWSTKYERCPCEGADKYTACTYTDDDDDETTPTSETSVTPSGSTTPTTNKTSTPHPTEDQE